MDLDAIREWARRKVTEDAEAGLIPPMAEDTADRLRILLGPDWR